MRPRLLRALLLGPLALVSGCGQPTPRPPGEAPGLVVLMVVDQLRADLLDQYDGLFGEGLRRLRDEGYRFENGTHDHAITHTAPGHETLATGVHPARHGIVGNSWFELEGERWRSVYSVEDPSRTILGHPELPGRGPANGRSRGLPDWIIGNDEGSRMVSVSRKDRAAIGLAALAAGDVYWLDDRSGDFVTSDFYRQEYPEWVVDFNRLVMPEVYADTVWRSGVPPAARRLTRPDTSRYELDGTHSAFPHRPSDLADGSDPEALNHWRYEYTPFPDRAVVAFAMEAVRALELGRRESVDYLGVSLSQTDLVGHHFGPGSREQLDNLLRLDAELGRFLSFLDDEVGPGRWVLALSADHGVLEIPEHLAERGIPAERLTRAHRQQLLDRLQEGLAAAAGGPAATSVQEALSTLPFVAGAYTFDQVERAQPADSFQVLFAHSHSRDRAVSLWERYGVYLRFHPGTLQWGSSPATHGSPYHYDRSVPIVFLGGAVRSGASGRPAATVDVAPTLAWLARIPTPDDLDGQILDEVRSR